MSNDAATLLVGASTDFLRNFSPFNRMEAEALAFVAERAVLAFHARGSEILTPEVRRADALLHRPARQDSGSPEPDRPP
jgi:hypothetical protein